MTRQKTILIIDDETDFVDAMRTSLGFRGYRVVSANDGHEGLEALRNSNPDLILLDVTMPRMGGFEFYNRISDGHGNAAVPTIVVSAREELKAIFKNAGVNDFITKPVHFEEMFKKIEAIIAGSAQPVVEAPKKRFKTEFKALLVENDDDFAKEVTDLFEETGYTVRRCHSGLQAVMKAKNETADIALIKLGLRDLPGDDVACTLKKLEKNATLPVVLYTRQYVTLDPLIMQNLCQKIGIDEILTLNEAKTLLRESDRLLNRA
ncbi:MAG: hypothetical protein COT00_04565 [Candidatus Omnitrophica bacterium CG07_land_8_20_14_0_80_50_8]|nr:MAG: hypothetical protein COT00_04565 [Candidatus Omnitrophica bacterium CG07_land_8_20_14_0_80_50_8]